MSSIVISGDTSGAVTLTVPAVAGTNTVTIANQTGTLNAAGPAFSAYQSTLQSIPSSTETKIQFQTEEFDTNNNFASSRFTPTVAGYYQINALLQPAAAYAGGFIQLYKNGTAYKSGNYTNTATSLGGFLLSTLAYCNGSTDYLEIYGAFTFAQNTATGATFTTFSGCLLRGA